MNTSIAMLVYNNYPNDSRVRRQAEALVDAGYDVDVIALQTRTDSWSYELNDVVVYEVPLRKKRGGALRYLWQYAGFFVLSSLWLTTLFFKRRYSVVHVNNMPNIIVFCALIPRLFGAKIILDIHDPFPELYAIKATGRRRAIVKRILTLEEKVSAGFVDHIITTTDLIKEVMVSRGVRHNKISVVMNAPDPSLFRLPPDERECPLRHARGTFTILYAGTIVERYGLANIARAVASLRECIPSLRFRVVGSGDYEGRFRTLVSELGIDDIVEVCSLRPVEQVPREYLAANAVFWFPVRNEFIDIIMCVKVLEALAMGVPVITTKTACHEYYFTHREVAFVESTETPVLASAIRALYDNYEERTPSRSATDRFIDRFGWHGERDKYYDVIEDLLAPTENSRETQQPENV